MKQIVKGKNNYHIGKMRFCKDADFKNKGATKTFVMSEHTEENMRLCPDITKLDEFYKVRNAYNDKQLSNQFSLEIIKCTQFNNKNCKNDTEI